MRTQLLKTVAHKLKKSAKRFLQSLRSITPHMSPAELRCYSDYLSKAQTVIEYGAGGSTILAAKNWHIKILTVESDPDWLKKLRWNRHIWLSERMGNLQLVHTDIGPVGKWGMPIDDTHILRWANYAAEPWHEPRNTELVLIDGRFRIACIAQTVINCTDETIIAVHDFWNRPAYHVALPLLRCLDKVDSLGIFKRAKSWSQSEAYRLSDEYSRDPN